MKVLSLNIRHGGGARLATICQYVRDVNPDIFVATEHRNSTELPQQLSDLGYAEQNSGSGNRNTVLVAARRSGDAVQIDPTRLVGLRFPTLTVFGTYFAQKNEKQRLFKMLLADPPVERTLLIGDFNTGEHYKDEEGKTFYCADLFAQLGTVGWTRLNATEPTWISASGNGFCIDHAFVAGGLSGSARYDHSTRKAGISDHSALLVTLDSPDL